MEAADTLRRESRDSIGEDPPTIRFGLYAEVNMNLIDGSSVWVQSVSQTLTEIEGVEVTLLLRAPAQRDVLTAPLRANPRIKLVSRRRSAMSDPWRSGTRSTPWSGSTANGASTTSSCAAPGSLPRPPAGSPSPGDSGPTT